MAIIQQIHGETIARFGGDGTPQPKEGCIDGSMGAVWNAELYSLAMMDPLAGSASLDVYSFTWSKIIAS